MYVPNDVADDVIFVAVGEQSHLAAAATFRVVFPFGLRPKSDGRSRRMPGAVALLLALLSSACSGISSAVPTPAARPATPIAAPSPSPAPLKTATPRAASGPVFVLIRAPQITAGARLNVQGQGFQADEQATVTVETTQGQAEAELDPGDDHERWQSRRSFCAAR